MNVISVSVMTKFYRRPSIDYIDYDNDYDDYNEVSVEEEPGFWQDLKSQVWNGIEDFFRDNSKRRIRFMRL